MTITDKCIIKTRINRKDWVIRLVEVERIERVPFSISSPFTRQRAIYMKVEKKVYSPTIRGRIASKIFNGPHELIPIDGVKMSPPQLCDLLNERLRNCK